MDRKFTEEPYRNNSTTRVTGIAGRRFNRRGPDGHDHPRQPGPRRRCNVCGVASPRSRSVASDKTLAEVSVHGNEADGRKLYRTERRVGERSGGLFARRRTSGNGEIEPRQKQWPGEGGARCNFAKCRERRIVPNRRAAVSGTRKQAGRGVALGSGILRQDLPPRRSRCVVDAGKLLEREESVRDLWHYQVKYSEHCPSPEKWRRRSQGTCDDAPPPYRLSTSHPFCFSSGSFAPGVLQFRETTSRPLLAFTSAGDAPSDEFPRSGCKPSRR